MGKTIQVRKVPDELHRTLRMQAAAADVSLSDYVLQLIEEMAARPANAAILRRAGEGGGGITPGLAAEAVRSGRDR